MAIRSYGILFSAAAPIHLWLRLLMWDFFLHLNLMQCSFSNSCNHFYFLSASAEGLKCQMQMQLLRYLDSYLLCFFYPSFILSVGWFQCPSKPCTSLSVPVSPRGHSTGVTHFPHLCWVLWITATLCLSKVPAAQRPHCVSHNKVFKF